MYQFQVFFEKIFLMRPLKPLFVTSDDSIHEWRFRWQLDRYVSKLFPIIMSLIYAFNRVVKPIIKQCLKVDWSIIIPPPQNVGGGGL
jgi:hypothetical protein